jgi:hypothetical protein
MVDQAPGQAGHGEVSPVHGRLVHFQGGDTGEADEALRDTLALPRLRTIVEGEDPVTARRKLENTVAEHVPDEEERAGRWAGSDKLECGIHEETPLKEAHA